MKRSIDTRLQILERNAIPEKARPEHRIIFEGDPEPTDRPPGSTVHRLSVRRVCAVPVNVREHKPG
jgi:hypothetical protein